MRVAGYRVVVRQTNGGACFLVWPTRELAEASARRLLQDPTIESAEVVPNLRQEAFVRNGAAVANGGSA
jgi:hypothetical protein